MGFCGRKLMKGFGLLLVLKFFKFLNWGFLNFFFGIVGIRWKGKGVVNGIFGWDGSNIELMFDFDFVFVLCIFLDLMFSDEKLGSSFLNGGGNLFFLFLEELEVFFVFGLFLLKLIVRCEVVFFKEGKVGNGGIDDFVGFCDLEDGKNILGIGKFGKLYIFGLGVVGGLVVGGGIYMVIGGGRVGVVVWIYIIGGRVVWGMMIFGDCVVDWNLGGELVVILGVGIWGLEFCDGNVFFWLVLNVFMFDVEIFNIVLIFNVCGLGVVVFFLDIILGKLGILVSKIF